MILIIDDLINNDNTWHFECQALFYVLYIWTHLIFFHQPCNIQTLIVSNLQTKGNKKPLELQEVKKLAQGHKLICGWVSSQIKQ